MLTHFRPALVMLALFTVLTGLLYPLVITGVAQIALNRQANGDLLERGGVVVGATNIGQNFVSARYFHGRPSATVGADPSDPAKTIDVPYNAANSAGSNLGPTSKKLVDRVNATIEAEFAVGRIDIVPADAATASASGLDPHISPQNALSQVVSVAAARRLPAGQVRRLVEDHVEGRFIGVIGEPRVNVLLLNLALDALK
jgi:potassium-transporting ATPase KdpC subunit